MKITAAMMSPYQRLFFLNLFITASWANNYTYPAFPDEGLDAAGYPVNNTDLSRMSEGKTRTSITERHHVNCSCDGKPTEACDMAGGFCIDISDFCPGATDRSACRSHGCKCCMPNITSECRPRRSCCSAGGYCVQDEADCKGVHHVIVSSGCKGRGCKCCIPSGHDLPWVYLDYGIGNGGDAFVSFPDRMNWYEAQRLCRSYGLNLYHPHNIIAVSEYLSTQTGPGNNGYWHWLGAKGNNLNMVWFNGVDLTWADPWYRPYTYFNNGTCDCLAFITWGDYWDLGTVLFAGIGSCTGRTDINPLCG